MQERSTMFVVLLSFTFFFSSEPPVSPQQLLPNAGATPTPERLHHIAERYAPFIYHTTDAKGGRQDIISNIDFDGDLVGNNNWENFERYELKPTVYYAVLETETHYFISFHLFHPRDWNHFTIWLHDTHENDGENFQVVVRKSDSRVVLLWTQAHYLGDVYANPGSGIQSGKTKLSGRFQLVDDRGIPSDTGRHVAVFVEAQGHGIYGSLDSSSEVEINTDGRFSFEDGSGLLFRPAHRGENIAEPKQWTSGDVPYQLDSITMKLWPLLRDGQLTGDGKLLDGPVRYGDELVSIGVPRYYDANRFSGPFGPDRGISPFALDFSFSQPDLGALFFNPARRYAERLTITDPWSRTYLQYSFQR
ncbi:MAG TPA: hypothetical protein VNL36_01310 [Bacteroidota bacterium]|nr:hypothetical protein [Bacteroidota bacterium]